jgi:hypothetical protein
MATKTWAASEWYSSDANNADEDWREKLADGYDLDDIAEYEVDRAERNGIAIEGGVEAMTLFVAQWAGIDTNDED